MTELQASRRNPARRLAFLLIAAFILIAPAIPQVLGVYAVWFRPWTMFSGVGVGLLKGDFIVTDANGGEVRVKPTEVLAVERYSRAMTTDFPYHVFADSDLPRVAARYCATMAAGARLGFDGYRQTRDGWVRLVADDLCGGS